MNKKTPEQRLAELQQRDAEREQKYKEEKARIRKLQKIEQGKINAEKKRRENKKKILVGAMYLDVIKNDAEKESAMMKRMDKFLTRASDRELFGLPPKLD